MSDLTKKLFVSTGLVFSFSLYILFLMPDAASSEMAATQTLALGVAAQPVVSTSSSLTTFPQTSVASASSSWAVPNPAPVQAPAPAPVSIPAPVPIQKPTGMYKDGTYDGSVADAYYGNVQVQVTVSGGKVSNIQFLQYPNDRSYSQKVSSQAMPVLIQEAIQAQSAQVATVSGATEISGAFQQSLASALSEAKA